MVSNRRGFVCKSSMEKGGVLYSCDGLDSMVRSTDDGVVYPAWSNSAVHPVSSLDPETHSKTFSHFPSENNHLQRTNSLCALRIHLSWIAVEFFPIYNDSICRSFS